MKTDIKDVMLAKYRQLEDSIIYNAVAAHLKRDLNHGDVAVIRKVFKYKSKTKYALYYQDLHLGDVKLSKTRITFKGVNVK